MYRRINAWLEREIVTRNLPYFITLAILCMWITSIAGHKLLLFAGFELSACRVSNIKEIPSLLEFANFMIPRVLLEEVEYRAPLLLVAYFARPLVIPSIIVSSAIFGWDHCDWTNIVVQGVSGVILSIVFLKCGGIHNKLAKGVLAVASVHILFNFSIWTLVRLT